MAARMDPLMWSIAPEVAAAIGGDKPVVALESTLLAQGLPWPVNLETARAAEAAVRNAGAVPATIAVLSGVITIGLNEREFEAVASPGRFAKAGRRDLPAAVLRRQDAATTVAATLWIARQAGIEVMATGGLGGAHRDAAATGDVSNDLDELARSDGALVVCAGVKSILDVPATLQRLETLGVVVASYRTDSFPGFTTRSSGLAIDTRVDSPREAAALLRAHRALGMPGAIVLAQPVDESVAIDREELERALAGALDEARCRTVTGKEITPWLLDAIRRATAGRSVVANQALIVANARLAAEIAVAVAALTAS